MSEEFDEEAGQPRPTVTDEPFVQDLVIADIEARKEMGIRKYGTALQASNGRDMLQDAYEEAMDLVIYLRGEIERRRITSHPPHVPDYVERVLVNLQRDAIVDAEKAALGHALEVIRRTDRSKKDGDPRAGAAGK